MIDGKLYLYHFFVTSAPALPLPLISDDDDIAASAVCQLAFKNIVMRVQQQWMERSGSRTLVFPESQPYYLEPRSCIGTP